MILSTEQFVKDAIRLPEDQRITIAHRLLSSIEPPLSAQIDSLWSDEIQRRVSSFRDGTMKTIPSENVFSDLRSGLQ